MPLALLLSTSIAETLSSPISSFVKKGILFDFVSISLYTFLSIGASYMFLLLLPLGC